MGIDELKSELSRRWVDLAGLKTQREILNTAYLHALTYSQRYAGKHGVSENCVDLELLRRTRAEVRIQCKTTYEDIMSSQNHFAPILRLPTELILQIFELCWNDGKISLASCSRATVQAIRLPWHLSGACRTWRNIALGMPSLWSNILLSFNTLLTPPFIISIWAQRCGKHPASLFWISNGDTIQCGHIHSIVPSLERVGAINIFTLQSSPGWQEMTVQERNTDNWALKQFHDVINSFLRDHPGLFKELNKIRWVAPRISWVSSPLPSIIQLGTSQIITHFTFAPIHTGNIRLLQVLSLMPLLKQATLCLPRRLHLVGQGELVSLTSLQTLRIAARDIWDAKRFLRHIVSPSLEYLDMNLGPTAITEYPPDETLDFFLLFFRNLKHIGIQDASRPMFPCLTTNLSSLFACQNAGGSLRSCYLRGHSNTFGDVEGLVALLQAIPKMEAYHIESGETVFTFGHSLIQLIGWADVVLSKSDLDSFVDP